MAQELPFEEAALQKEIQAIRKENKIPDTIKVEKKGNVFYLTSSHGEETLEEWIERLSVYEDSDENKNEKYMKGQY